MALNYRLVFAWHYTLRTRICLALYCNTVGFGAKPYELVFAWRYTLRTRIHLALYCNTPYGPYPTLLAPAAETVSRYVRGCITGARLRTDQSPAKNYCIYLTTGARVYKGKRQLPRLSRYVPIANQIRVRKVRRQTRQHCSIAPDTYESVRCSAKPDSIAV